MNIAVTIAFILLVVLGLLMLFAPGLLIREDKRDDPQAVSCSAMSRTATRRLCWNVRMSS